MATDSKRMPVADKTMMFIPNISEIAILCVKECSEKSNVAKEKHFWRQAVWALEKLRGVKPLAGIEQRANFKPAG